MIDDELRKLSVYDCHCHTEFAYCGREISAAEVVERAKKLPLAGVCLVEHAPHLYILKEDFWQGQYIKNPTLWMSEDNSRAAHFELVMKPLKSDFTYVGLEVELDCSRQLTIKPHDRGFADMLVGAVHFLPVDPGELDDQQLTRLFMDTCFGLITSGIDILAHPWRYFQWAKRPVPTHMFPALADMLAAGGVAAEINMHKNMNDHTFYTMCIERGVKVSFGSDSHELQQVGNFAGHLEILKLAAGTDDPEKLAPLLWRPPPRKKKANHKVSRH